MITVADAWCCWVSVGTGWPCVKILWQILWQNEPATLILNFSLNVAGCQTVRADIVYWKCCWNIEQAANHFLTVCYSVVDARFGHKWPQYLERRLLCLRNGTLFLVFIVTSILFVSRTRQNFSSTFFPQEKDETDSGYRSGTIPDEKLPKAPSQATLNRRELQRKIQAFNHFVPKAKLEMVRYFARDLSFTK